MIYIESIFVNSIVNDGDPANFIVIESSFIGGGGGGGTWGSIVGTLSNQTDLQSALDAKVPYTGATGNITLGEYGLTTGYSQFDTTPTQTGGVGRLIWNDTDGTLDLGLKGGNVTLQIGQEEVVRVVNKTGSSLNESAYQVVRVSTAQGQRLGVQLAQANNDANSADTLGIVTETIANNQEGFITVSGLVNNINTTGTLQGETWADGDLLFLSPTTAGAITNVRPTAPNHTVILGYVVYAHANNGKIYVKVDNGYELDELHNVKITTPTNGQVLKYNSSLTVWENSSDAGVTSVAMTVPTGLTISGSPITSAGTLALTYTTGYSIPTNTKQSNWDDAYTFVGNFPTQTGQSGKYLTTNGSVLSWATITAGTVTSVSGTGTAFGLTLTGTVTTSGSLTLGGTLAVPVANITATGTPSASTFLRGDGSWQTVTTTNFYTSDGTLTSNRTVTQAGNSITFTGGSVTFAGAVTGTGNTSNFTVTASSGVARSKFISSTLVAAANSDTLVGLDIAVSSTLGAFTGLQQFAIRTGSTFAPTSGGTTMTSVRVAPTINQTGGANGITRGLHIAPTLTAAADYRGIEWSNTTGWGLYGSGSANNYILGDTVLGTTTLGTATKLTVGGSETAASAIARGSLINTTLVAAANNDVLVGLDVNPTFTVGAFTGLTRLGLRVVDGGARVSTTTAGATALQATGTTGNLMTVTDASTGTILTVNGSSGTLMTVTDAVTGNIFNVNDSGGTTRFRVNSNGAIYQNSITVTGFSSATNTIISIDKTTGNTANYDYVLWNATTGAYRAGTLTAVWDGTNIAYKETTTTDLVASTAAVTLSADISGANTRLIAAVSSGTWNIRIGARIV